MPAETREILFKLFAWGAKWSFFGEFIRGKESSIVSSQVITAKAATETNFDGGKDFPKRLSASSAFLEKAAKELFQIAEKGIIPVK